MSDLSTLLQELAARRAEHSKAAIYRLVVVNSGYATTDELARAYEKLADAEARLFVAVDRVVQLSAVAVVEAARG